MNIAPIEKYLLCVNKIGCCNALLRPFSNRDPFDPVVKEAGSNPDVMGSNPMTSRFFAHAAISV